MEKHYTTRETKHNFYVKQLQITSVANYYLSRTPILNWFNTLKDDQSSQSKSSEKYEKDNNTL